MSSDIELALTGVRAVSPDAVIENATVVVVDGRIESVRTNGAAPPGAVDGRGLLLVAGLVDSHSDGLEKEISPRRTVELPLDYAAGSFEARVRAAGISTIFHGVAYQDRPRIGRSVNQSREVCAVLDERRRVGSATIDHCLLYRFEARDPVAVEPLLNDVARTRAAGVPALVSFEDHTPGQGQYRDPAQFEAAVDPETLPDGVTAADYVQQLIAEADERRALRDKNMARLAPLATAGEITLLVHDPETPADIEAAATAGARVAEFPVTIEAAQAAREAGMAIVMGAPNALRGLSHSGNLSARELVAAGLCDVIASDYMPSAMLAAVFAMVADGCCTLPVGIALVTSGPARMAGLDDRGHLTEGARADLTLVDDRHRWPAVVATHLAADSPERRMLVTGVCHTA